MKSEFNVIRFTEKMVNEGLRKALRERDATDSIEVFIEHLGKQSTSERIYIFEGGKNGPVSNTFEWCAEGISSEKKNLQDVPFEAVKWWYDIFETQSCVVIKDLEMIKDKEPLTYEYLKPQNIHSLITAPLYLEDEIIGFWGVDNPPSHLMDYTEEMTEIVAHFIVSLLEKRRLMKSLEKMSFRDPLTETKNRHALSADMDSFDQYREVGILYCDVLGLKKINDTLGHLEGDKLIIRAAKCLQKVFRKNEVYRIGGDEFMVMSMNIKEDVFLEKIKTLRKLMVEYESNMSLGFVWKKDTLDVAAMMAEADDLMYEEKRAYYAIHGREEDIRLQ